MIHSFEQALALILKNVLPLESEWIDLDALAGRVAAEDFAAPHDLPRWDNSEMDGFAVRAADCQPFATLRVIGYLPAGASTEEVSVEPGTAVRIMTGAPLPSGSDAIVPIEHTEDKQSSIRLKKSVFRGDYIRFRGSDVTIGEVMIPAGTVLRPAEINLLASFSCLRAKVYRQPRVAILSTGDELVPPGEQPGPGQIIDSNSYSLAAAVREVGAEPIMLGIARDEPESLKTKIDEGLRADVLITSAGVSTGDRDLVRQGLEEAGARQLFWRVNIKPGGPTAFAVQGKRLIFSLPGNPVSSMIAFDQLVRPALLSLMGRQKANRKRVTARLLSPLINETQKLRFLRVRVMETQECFYVESAGDQNTGIIGTMIRANGIVALPADCSRLETDETVDVQLLDPSGLDFAELENRSMVQQTTIKALSFVARSGTGKTTLLERVIGELRQRGYRVGACKAVSHQFDIDRPGKDSFRMTNAGSEATMIFSNERVALVKNLSEAPDIKQQLSTYFSGFDIVLVEGDKTGPLPKIEVYRSGYSDSLLCCSEADTASYIAVASDCPLDLPVPLLDLNVPAQVADFIVAEVLSQ